LALNVYFLIANGAGQVIYFVCYFSAAFFTIIIVVAVRAYNLGVDKSEACYTSSMKSPEAGVTAIQLARFCAFKAVIIIKIILI
jgi:hypothetical protein